MNLQGGPKAYKSNLYGLMEGSVNCEWSSACLDIPRTLHRTAAVFFGSFRPQWTFSLSVLDDIPVLESGWILLMTAMTEYFNFCH